MTLAATMAAEFVRHPTSAPVLDRMRATLDTVRVDHERLFRRWLSRHKKAQP